MLFLDGIIFSIQKYGGISTYFKELYDGLNKHKIENKLIIYGKNSSFFENNVEIKSKRILERYRNLKNIPKKSIFHSSYYRSSNQKNVITVYDFTYEKFPNSFFDKIHINQKKNAIVKSDMIICISENTKNDLLYYYPEASKKKIFVTHLAASKNYCNKQIDFKSRILKPYILFVGSRSTYKNFIPLVESMKNFPDLSLYIIGGGDFSKEEIIILEKNCGNRYKHFKNLDNNDLNDLYNYALSLVYPSLYEGFGIPVIEAMSTGCPVIASNCSSIAEIAKDYSILLDDSNTENISDAIDKVLIKENFEYYQKKGLENSLKFSWNKTVANTLECYKKI